jgi:hypothetical protein
VLPAEHLLGFGGFDFGFERGKRALEIGADILPLLGPLQQHPEIVEPPDERIPEVDFFAQAAAPLQEALRVRLVLPELWRGDALF